MARKFEDGIASYIMARATVTVGFPVDYNGVADICCEQCRFFRQQSRTCALNNALINYPHYYIGGECPLTIEETVEHKQKENKDAEQN